MSHTTKHPYTRSKAIDPSCRSHGDCPHCQGNRQHKHKRRMAQGDGLDWLLEGEEVGVNVRKQDLQDVLAHFKHYTNEPVHLRFCITTTLALSNVERTRFQDRTVIEVATKWEQLPIASLVVDGHKCQFTFKAQEAEPVVRVELVITE